MKKRYFSPAFKEKVVLQSYQVKSIKVFAEELGIRPSLLYTWRRASDSPLANQLEEIKRLKRKLLAQQRTLEIIKKSQAQNIATNKEKYQFVKENSATYSVIILCEALNISNSCYYRWLNIGDRVMDKLQLDNQKYALLIKEIFERSSQTYGSTRIKKALERKGHFISRKRVSRIMVANGWKSKHQRLFRYCSSNSAATDVPNLLNQQFEAKRLNEIWVSDLTYIPTIEGWIYLTIVLDLYDRKIISWTLSPERTASTTTVPAWQKALENRPITQPLIFHSDRGVEYTCNAFQEELENNPHVSISRSRQGNCWDNAVAESLFKTIKVELLQDYTFDSLEQATVLISQYIDNWYNQERLHSALNYQTPKEKEEAAKAA